jgi:hypothetical protein
MTKELCKLDIDGLPCPKCQNRDLIIKGDDNTKVICADCGFESNNPTNELWAVLQGMKSKMDYEGGMAEVLLNYSDASFFDVGDEKLLEAAKKAEQAFLRFEMQWRRICKENGISHTL